VGGRPVPILGNSCLRWRGSTRGRHLPRMDSHVDPETEPASARLGILLLAIAAPFGVIALLASPRLRSDSGAVKDLGKPGAGPVYHFTVAGVSLSSETC
jgi:hypothetical protein